MPAEKCHYMIGEYLNDLQLGKLLNNMERLKPTVLNVHINGEEKHKFECI